MALPQPRPGDLHEPTGSAHLRHGRATGIAHRRAQPPDELVHDRSGGALVGHLPLDPFRHQLVGGGVLLEISIGRTPCHRAQRPHPAVGLERPSLIQDHLARALVRPGDHRAHHRAGSPGGDGLGEVTRILDAAIGDHRDVARGPRRVHDRRQLRHAHAGDDPGRADGARPDADLHRIRARADERAGAFGGRHVAGDHLHVVRQPLDPIDRQAHALGMPMRRVDHDQVAPRVDQRLRPLEAGVAHRRRGRHAQAPQTVLAGLWVDHGLLDVLDRQEPGQMPLRVHDQQLLDPARVHHRTRLRQIGRFAQDGKVVGGHHGGHRCRVVIGEAHVPVGDDAEHAPPIVHDGEARDAVAFLQRLGVQQRLVGPQRDRIVDHPALEPLDAPHFLLLRVEIEVAMDHAHPAGLRHGDGHPRLRHSVHGRGQQRDVQSDAPRHLRARIGGARQDAALGRDQQHVVEGEGLANLHRGAPSVGCRLAISCFTGRVGEQVQVSSAASNARAPASPCDDTSSEPRSNGVRPLPRHPTTRSLRSAA